MTGFDGLSDYYDVTLKGVRLAELAPYAGFTPVEGQLQDSGLLAGSLRDAGPMW